MTFKSASTSTTIGIGGTASDLDLTTALIGNITTPNLIIGDVTNTGGISIQGDPSLSGMALTLASSGNITQSASLTADSLELLGDANVTLNNAGNNVGALAGNTGNLNYVNSGALIIGTVNTTNGITSTGTLDITTVSGDIDINNDLSWSSNLFTLTAANDININATLTATGTADLTMTANNNATDTNPFNSALTPQQVRDALGTIGRIRMGMANDDSGFTGKLDYSSSGALTMNGEAYTVISDLAGLQGMTMDNAAARYALGSDIDASALTTKLGKFDGKLDGFGHSIDGFNISDAWYVGLFEELGVSSVIRGLGITNATVTATNFRAGLLVGKYTGGEIYNVFSQGTVSASGSQAGGLIGYVSVDGSAAPGKTFLLENVFSSASVSGGQGTAGLIGYMHAGNSSATTIILQNTHATGNVSGHSYNTGGLIGGSLFGDPVRIFDSFATGSVTQTGGSNWSTGGLVGRSDGSAVYDNVFATGDVSGQGQAIGGLIGYKRGNHVINNAYTAGDVSGSAAGSVNVGGLMGRVDNAAGTTISNAFASGTVTNANAVAAETTGGLFGITDGNPSMTNVYWNSEANSAITGTNSSAVTGATGRTDTQFAALTDANLGNSGTFTIDTGYPYPIIVSSIFPLSVQAASFPPISLYLLTATGNSTYGSVPGLSYSWVDSGGSVFSLTSNGVTESGSISYSNAPTATSDVGVYNYSYGSGLSLSHDIFTYAVNPYGTDGTWTLTPAPLTITGFASDSKSYTGTTEAVIANTGSLSGLINSDLVSFSNSGATFDNANVGTGKTVTLNGVSLTGTDSANYSYGVVTTDLSNITAAPLTVTASDQSKSYGDSLNLGSSAFTSSDLVNSETIGAVTLTGTGGYHSSTTANAGIYADDLVASLATGGSFSASNYNITYATGDLTIDPKALTITGFASDNKIYTGTTEAVIADAGSLSGLINSDSVSFSSSGATFDNANVGTGKTVTLNGVTLTGTDNTNYSFSATTTDLSDITAAALTVTATTEARPTATT